MTLATSAREKGDTMGILFTELFHGINSIRTDVHRTFNPKNKSLEERLFGDQAGEGSGQYRHYPLEPEYASDATSSPKAEAEPKQPKSAVADGDQQVNPLRAVPTVDVEPWEIKEYKPGGPVVVPKPIDPANIKLTPEQLNKRITLSKKRVIKLMNYLHEVMPSSPEYILDTVVLVVLYITEQVDLETMYQLSPETDPDDGDPEVNEIINLISMILNDMLIDPNKKPATPVDSKALYSIMQNVLQFMRGYDKIITTQSASIMDNMIRKLKNLLLKLDKKEEKEANKKEKDSKDANQQNNVNPFKQASGSTKENPVVKRKASEPVTVALDFVDPRDPSKTISNMSTISQVLFNKVQQELQKIFAGLELNVTVNRTITGLIVIGIVRDPVMRITEYYYVDPDYVVGNGYNLMAMANTPEQQLGYAWVNLKHVDLCKKILSIPNYILTPEELRLVKADQFDDGVIYNYIDMTRPSGVKKWIGDMSFDERKALGNKLHAIINLDDAWDSPDKPWMVTTRLRFKSYTDVNHFTLVADLKCKSPVMSWVDSRGEHWGAVNTIASDTQVTVVDNVITYQRNEHMLNFDIVAAN